MEGPFVECPIRDWCRGWRHGRFEGRSGGVDGDYRLR